MSLFFLFTSIQQILTIFEQDDINTLHNIYFLFQRKLSDSQVRQFCRTSSIHDGILSLLLLLELQHDLQQTQGKEIPMVIREMHIIDSLLIII